jgi:hypothetical protein
VSNPIAMHLIPVSVAAFTALGAVYFGLDLYKNRRRLSAAPKPPVTLWCVDPLPMGPENDAQALAQAASHIGHAVGEAGAGISGDVGACVDAIAHTLSGH